LSETKPLVSIIILNYNAGDLLLNCVESVIRSTYKNTEIIVVDNVSQDNSHRMCKEKVDSIHLIENQENLGYCEGNNVGIRNAKGDFIVILNPDTIVEEKWIENLLDAHNQKGDGLYQPKILSLDDKKILQSTGNMIQIFGFGFAREKGEEDNKIHHKIEKIGYASGTCLFASSKVFKKIGLLDSFIFLYHDDLDLGWRAAQIGIKSYFVPKSVIYHAESYSLKWSEKKFFWLERNRKYCLLTHYSKQTQKKMFFSLMMVDILVWIFYISKGFFRAKIKAEIEIRKNKSVIEKKYEELEKKKIVLDEELIRLFPDSIFVPKNVSSSIMSKFFNMILTKLSKNTKKHY